MQNTEEAPKPVFIIHNMKYVTDEKELMSRIQREVIGSFKVKEKHYNLSKQEGDIVIYEDHSYSTQMPVTHLIMMNNIVQTQ